MRIIGITIIICTLCWQTAHSAGIKQFLLLTGGTSGIGGKYSLFYRSISVEAGLPIMFRYYRNDENEAYSRIRMVFDQYFSLHVTIVNNPTFLLRLGAIEFNRFGYHSLTYDNDSLEGESYPIFDSRIGITLDFIGQYKQVKRYGFQITPFSFGIGTKKVDWETVVQLNFFLKPVGKKEADEKM